MSTTANVVIPSDQIVIDPEFANLVPPLSKQEADDLEQDLRAKGCLAPLIVCRIPEYAHFLLLDGRYRLDICQRYDLPFECQVLEFPDYDAARTYLIELQLGNPITPESASYMRGCHYRLIRQTHGGDRRGEFSSFHFGPLKTAQRLAQVYHPVSERTIRRDAEFADAVDTLVTNCGPHAKPLILARYAGLGKRRILRLSRRPLAYQQAFLQKLQQTGKPPRDKRVGPKTITLPTDMQEFTAALIKRWGEARAAKLAQMILDETG